MNVLCVFKSNVPQTQSIQKISFWCSKKIEIKWCHRCLCLATLLWKNCNFVKKYVEFGVQRIYSYFLGWWLYSCFFFIETWKSFIIEALYIRIGKWIMTECAMCTLYNFDSFSWIIICILFLFRLLTSVIEFVKCWMHSLLNSIIIELAPLFRGAKPLDPVG